MAAPSTEPHGQELETIRNAIYTLDNRPDKPTAEMRHAALVALEALHSRVEQAEKALAHLFEVWLPTAECNGPRDCSGTSRGCSHCCSSADLESIRAAFPAARAVVSAAPEEQE